MLTEKHADDDAKKTTDDWHISGPLAPFLPPQKSLYVLDSPLSPHLDDQVTHGLAVRRGLKLDSFAKFERLGGRFGYKTRG